MKSYPWRFAVLILIAGFGLAYKCAADNADWMRPLDGRQSLANLSIPGSHDSGARYNLCHLPDSARCQTLSIADQLDAGVRFLDIRCKLTHGRLAIYHGCANQHLDFSCVAETCRQFLGAHSNECLVVSIQRENGPTDGFAAAVQAILDSHPDLWFTNDFVPTLAQARRRLVLLRRYAGAAVGIDATHWPDNKTFTNTRGATSLAIQDEYKVWCNSHKWNAITNFLRRAAQSTDQSLYLNFTSGSHRTLPYPRIRLTANNINPRLLSFARSTPTGHYGVVIMDFVTPDLCSAIINLNPPLRAPPKSD